MPSTSCLLKYNLKIQSLILMIKMTRERKRMSWLGLTKQYKKN